MKDAKFDGAGDLSPSDERAGYPVGVPCVWLASDSLGHVAACISGGEGVIPLSALRNRTLDVADVWEEIEKRLPRLDPSGPEGDGLACRGLFVFEWEYRKGEFGGVYVRIAIPRVPVEVSALPEPIKSLAFELRLMSRISDSKELSRQHQDFPVGLMMC